MQEVSKNVTRRANGVPSFLVHDESNKACKTILSMDPYIHDPWSIHPWPSACLSLSFYIVRLSLVSVHARTILICIVVCTLSLQESIRKGVRQTKHGPTTYTPTVLHSYYGRWVGLTSPVEW
jgi:hypothetical protein